MITKDGDRATLRLENDVVASSAADLRLTLRRLVAEGTRQLVMDLEEVQMVDSVGLGLLISTHNTLQKLGGELAVVGVSADILQLLTSMRMHQHFSVSGR